MVNLALVVLVVMAHHCVLFYNAVTVWQPVFLVLHVICYI